MKKILVVALIALLPAGTAGQSRQAPLNVSRDRLARIDRALQQYVDENRVAGAVALVLRDGRPIYERAVGWSDKEAGRRMTPDTIFRIASQTKAITSTAILALMGLASAMAKRLPEGVLPWAR